MIRAGKIVLALSISLIVMGADRAFAQMEGPGGLVYGQPASEPPAYVADDCEESWVDMGAVQQRLANPVETWTFRTEYLNWSLSDPGDTLLGANILGNGNPRIPFTATDPGGTTIGTAIVPSTSPLQLRSNNGLKLIAGADFTMGGRLEVNAFLLEKATSGFTLFGGINAQKNQQYDLIATSTNINNGLNNNLLFYNDKFSACYESRFWGAGTEYLFDVDREGIFWFQPAIGVRYFSLDERLTQVGLFTDQTFSPSTTLTSTIDSKSYNNIVGPQVGFRAELKGKWFSLGIDPRFGVAANLQKARVSSDNFRSEQDPLVVSTSRYVGTTLFYDVGTWAQLNLNPNFSLRAGYNVTWFNKVNRPENNIIYNDNGPFPTPPDIRATMSRHTIGIEGLTLGAEFKW